MGQSTNAILAYGYNLGDDEEWKVREITGEYGALAVDWYDPEGDDDGDFMGAAERRLLAELAGFTEEWHSGNEGYFAREREAKARLGVEIESYCSGEYPMWILAAKVITVYRGSIEEIDPVELAAEPARNSWDDKLTTALRALGLTPTQERARWLLCSYRG